MKKKHRALLALTLSLAAISLLCIYMYLWGSRNLTSPRYCNGHKWRIGYAQGGDFSTYQNNLKGLINGLAKRGWLKINWHKLPEKASAREIWDYICKNARSQYLFFSKDAFWSADWNRKLRSANRREILKRLSREKNIDLMLAMGLWSGADLANSAHDVPTMIMGVRDPVGAGIVRSYNDSGRNHIQAQCKPDYITRQIGMFHLLTNFKILGVVYDPSPAGKSWSHLERLRQAAQEKGFALLEKPVKQFGRPHAEAVADLTAAYSELAKKVDAMWLTSILLDDIDHVPEILAPLQEAKIPTWTPLGEKPVQYGVLFGETASSPKQYEDFYGITAAKIMNGIAPRDLNQIFDNKNELFINNAVAKKINFNFPPGVFFATDKTYTSIKE